MKYETIPVTIEAIQVNFGGVTKSGNVFKPTDWIITQDPVTQELLVVMTNAEFLSKYRIQSPLMEPSLPWRTQEEVSEYIRNRSPKISWSEPVWSQSQLQIMSKQCSREEFQKRFVKPNNSSMLVTKS